MASCQLTDSTGRYLQKTSTDCCPQQPNIAAALPKICPGKTMSKKLCVAVVRHSSRSSLSAWNPCKNPLLESLPFPGVHHQATAPSERPRIARGDSRSYQLHPRPRIQSLTCLFSYSSLCLLICYDDLVFLIEAMICTTAIRLISHKRFSHHIAHFVSNTLDDFSVLPVNIASHLQRCLAVVTLEV